jgi:uncharacterized protein YwgA
MQKESFRYLAGVIAAHEGGKVVGRTRLQKTVYLLQHMGLPTDLPYSLHFYGPYSDGLLPVLRLAQRFRLVEEQWKTGQDNEYYVYQAAPDAAIPEMSDFLGPLAHIQRTQDVPLELAATYHAFRELGYDHPDAVERLRRKKGVKCTPEHEAMALTLLRELGLPAGQ